MAAEEEGNTKTLLSARASLKKKPGYLYLTDEPHRLVWVNEHTQQLSMHFLTSELTSWSRFPNYVPLLFKRFRELDLFANKPGLLPPKLKVVGHGAEYNLVFTDEEPLGTTQRDAFRDQVKALIRGGADATTQQSSVVDAGEADDAGSPDVCPPRVT
jgi:hypothetical protein